MKRKKTYILLRTPLGRIFLFLWIMGFYLLVARIGFDLRTACFGSKMICRNLHYDYLMHVPPGIHDTKHRYPLLIYLHGAGERNRSVRRLAKADVVHFAGSVAKSSEFPFLVVCPKTEAPSWEPDRVIGLLDELLQDENLRWKIDPTRIYLTGFSMGAYGVWETAMQCPDRFAAIVPVAGGGRPEQVEHFDGLPVWAFHGGQDDVVPCESSIEMLDALQSRYPDQRENYRMTVYPEADHGIARQVYENSELYRWLLRYRKMAERASPP